MAVYKIYCDESRQNSKGFKLVGGIWIRNDLGWPFVDQFLERCKQKYNICPSHMKWGKVPNNTQGKYFNMYKDLIDLYFKYNNGNKIFFKVLIVDDDYDMQHPYYHDGDFEKGFYTLYYHLILHTLQAKNKYHLRIATRNPSKKITPMSEMERLKDVKNVLNNGFRKKMRYMYYDDIILSVESRPAKERILIQLADILMGAIGYHWCNEHKKPNAKPGKVKLAEYICNKIGKKDLKFTSIWNDRVFNIFYMKPKN